MSIKWLGYLVIAVMVLNLILFAMSIVSQTIFWVVIVVAGILAYKVIPKISAHKK